MKNLLFFLFYCFCLGGYGQQVVLDTTFNPKNILTFRPQNSLQPQFSSATLQQDGKIIVNGGFITNNGYGLSHNARLKSDGSLDSSYNPVGEGFNGKVNCATIQSDGKIIVGGSFTGTKYGGNWLYGVIRLNPDGTRDLAYNGNTNFANYAPGFDREVNCISVQPDGKIIVLGNFTKYLLGGDPAFKIARLNLNGTLDKYTFVSPTQTSFGFGGEVDCMIIQPDGKIIIGGRFKSFNGVVREGILRLTKDGTLDVTFIPSIKTYMQNVTSLTLQPDGKIIVGGGGIGPTGIETHKIVRLNLDGTIDTSFNVANVSGYLICATLQSDGKIIVGGNFTSLNGIPRNYLARLNTDGTLDLSFKFGNGFNGAVKSIIIQPDKKIIVGGDFTSFNGIIRNYIARLYDCTLNPLPLPTVSVSGSTILCQGESVTLTSSNGSSYLWSTGETTSSISTTSTGSYTVEVTASNGCRNTSTQTLVSVNPLPIATISANGPTTFCQGRSVSLISSNGSSYLWSTGEITKIITPTTSGNYTVEVTDNGCKKTSSSKIVKVNPSPTATITAGGSTTFCQGGSVLLTSSIGSSYLWSTGASTSSISTTTAGSYTVEVTDINGCLNVSPPISVIVTNCAGIEEVESSFVKIYPNPTNDVLFIKNENFQSNDEYTINILSITGLLVYSQTITSEQSQISMNNIGEKGIYLAQILNKNNQVIENKKIVLE